MGSNRYRALVVDDEAAIRKLIVGALRKLEFDCDDAADGNDAARLAAQSRYDVVIADLKMPNKNGHALSLELLEQDNRPLIVVHTGIMEPRLAQDLLMRGVDDIIYKPTDFGMIAAKIKAMVERRPRQNIESNHVASRPQHALKPTPAEEQSTSDPVNLSQLNAKLAQISAVLPVSHAALDVFEMTRSDAWKVSQIAAAIQRDASLVVEVLRLANSSLYNPSGRRIINLDEAVVRIGQKRVRALALATNALSAIAPGMLPWIDLELAWKRSMAAGIVIEALVELGCHQEIEEGLLLSAIMHPLGRVALAMLFPIHYEAMVQRCEQTGESLREQERRMFPTSHTEVMAHLLTNWRIPPDVSLPLKYSLDDFSSLTRLSEPTRTRAELVKIAIVLGRLAAGRWENWDLVQFPSQRVLNRLRIDDVGQIIDQTRSDVSKLAEFHPDGSSISQPSESAPVERPAAYCNLSGGTTDFLLQMLPSMGLRPKACNADEIRLSKQPTIVNFLGAASDRSAIVGGRANIIAVTEQENRGVIDRFSRTTVLPESYARFRDALLSVVRRPKAKQARVASSRSK